MSSKVTSEHLGRIAVVYVRQSTMVQVTGNLESQRRQYELAGAAEKAGFASVTVSTTILDVPVPPAAAARLRAACGDGLLRRCRSRLLDRGFAVSAKRARLAPPDRLCVGGSRGHRPRWSL